jgi:hypothetical protein
MLKSPEGEQHTLFKPLGLYWMHTQQQHLPELIGILDSLVIILTNKQY